MISDDFEQQLRRQPMRPIPRGWREKILHAALVKAYPPASLPCPFPKAQSLSPSACWWRDLFWPCPKAWAALAAIWVLILVINFAETDTPLLAHHTPARPSPETLQLLQEQKRLYAELLSPAALPPVEPPKTFLPRPRSERRTAFIAV